MYPKNKIFAKESLFVILSFCCMLLIIFVTSIANAGLDPSKLWTTENLSNALINISITIFGIVSAVPSGTVATKQRIGPDGVPGRYVQDFISYNEIRTKIEPKRFKFGQWHHAQFLEENKSKKVNYLQERGIQQAEEILDLDREQILNLEKSQMFEVNGMQRYYKALSINQIIACLRVYDGRVIVHKLSDFYFLYIDGKGKRSFYDQAYYQSQDERFTFFSKLIFKIFIGFVITSIFASFVVQYHAADEVNAALVFKIMLTILTRVFNALSSTMWGYLIGQETVYKKCYYINGKTQFLQSFDSDESFKYRDLQEIAAEEYKKNKGVVNGTDTGLKATPDSP